MCAYITLIQVALCCKSSMLAMIQAFCSADLQELHVQDCGRPIQNWLAKTLNHRKALTSLAIGKNVLLEK